MSFAWFFSSWACCCFSVSFLNRAALSSLSKWYFLYNTIFFKIFLSVSIGYLLPKKKEKTKCPWTTMLTWEKVSNSAEDWANLCLNPKHWTHKKIRKYHCLHFFKKNGPLFVKKFNFPHLHKLEFFWHKDVLCHVWLKWSSGPGEEDFWKLSMYFFM